MPSIPRLSARQGLLRYRADRLGLLGELGNHAAPIVESSLGPLRLIIVTDADLARELLVKHAGKLTKGPAISRFSRPYLGDGLLSAEGSSHRRQRKMLSPKFQPRHMEQYADDMIAEAAAMFERWRAGRCSGDFSLEMAELTMAIAARTMLGTTVADVVDTVTEALDVGNRYIMNAAVSLVRLPLAVPTRENRGVKRALARLDGVIYDMIRKHRERSDDPGDVLSVLLDARDDDGSALDTKLVRDQVVTFFLAGHETTANALSWAYPLLCDHPDVARRLADEAEQVLGERRPTFADVAQLPYAAQVFKESIRLYPPSYMIGRRASEAFALAGYDIPGGAYVLVNTYGMQRRADHFPDPKAFRPERFDDEDSWPRLAFAAFGAGPRVCIGGHFAMLEGVIILAMLARQIQFSDRGFDYDAEPLVTLRPRNGIPFHVRWRDDAARGAA